MQSEYMLVTFKDNRMVKANDKPVGVTNHLMVLPPGDYQVTLDGDGFTPASQDIELIGTSHVRPMVVIFA
jgi:PEGA domain-containing protein